MDIIRYDAYEEIVYQETLPNGMKVIYIPKPEFSKVYAAMTVKVGSVHIQGEQEVYPAGIAHFLEHKMFDLHGKDATDEFAKYGASVNAYTTFDRTCYYFTTTAHIKENLKLLLEMVQTLEVTAESVEKEQGIIAEEIKMYQDMPDAEIFFHTFLNLFVDHPLHLDIAGSLESIQDITSENLTRCFQEFYHPNNVEMVIAGNIDVTEISKFIQKNQFVQSYKETKSIQIPYEEAVRTNQAVLKIEDGLDKYLLAYKQPPSFYQGEYERTRLAMAIYMDALFGSASDNVEYLQEKALINDSFTTSSYLEPEYGIMLLGGDSTDVKELSKEIKRMLKEVISEDEFNHIKQKMIGSYIRLFNSVEATASEFVSFSMVNTNLFDVPNVLESIQYEEVLRMREFFLGQYTETFMK